MGKGLFQKRRINRQHRQRQQQSSRWGQLENQLVRSLGLSSMLIFTLVLVAVVASLYGYKTGVDDGYHRAQMQPGADLPGFLEERQTREMITATGNWTVDGYHFYLRQDGAGELDGATTGYTNARYDIWIQTDRPVRDVYSTCVHEKLHNVQRLAPHGWIYDNQERIVDPTCLKLVYRVGTTATKK